MHRNYEDSRMDFQESLTDALPPSDDFVPSPAVSEMVEDSNQMGDLNGGDSCESIEIGDTHSSLVDSVPSPAVLEEVEDSNQIVDLKRESLEFGGQEVTVSNLNVRADEIISQFTQLFSKNATSQVYLDESAWHNVLLYLFPDHISSEQALSSFQGAKGNGSESTKIDWTIMIHSMEQDLEMNSDLEQCPTKHYQYFGVIGPTEVPGEELMYMVEELREWRITIGEPAVEEVKDLQRQMNNLKMESKYRTQEYESTIETLENQIEFLKENTCQLESENVMLKNHLDNANADSETLSKTNDMLSDSENQIRIELIKSVDDVEQSKKELYKKIEENQSLVAKIQRLQMEVSSTKLMVDITSKEKNSANKRAQDIKKHLTSRIEILSEENMGLRKRVSELEHQELRSSTIRELDHQNVPPQISLSPGIRISMTNAARSKRRAESVQILKSISTPSSRRYTIDEALSNLSSVSNNLGHPYSKQRDISRPSTGSSDKANQASIPGSASVVNLLRFDEDSDDSMGEVVNYVELGDLQSDLKQGLQEIKKEISNALSPKRTFEAQKEPTNDLRANLSGLNDKLEKIEKGHAKMLEKIQMLEKKEQTPKLPGMQEDPIIHEVVELTSIEQCVRTVVQILQKDQITSKDDLCSFTDAMKSYVEKLDESSELKDVMSKHLAKINSNFQAIDTQHSAILEKIEKLSEIETVSKSEGPGSSQNVNNVHERSTEGLETGINDITIKLKKYKETELMQSELLTDIIDALKSLKSNQESAQDDLTSFITIMKNHMKGQEKFGSDIKCLSSEDVIQFHEKLADIGRRHSEIVEKIDKLENFDLQRNISAVSRDVLENLNEEHISIIQRLENKIKEHTTKMDKELQVEISSNQALANIIESFKQLKIEQYSSYEDMKLFVERMKEHVQQAATFDVEYSKKFMSSLKRIEGYESNETSSREVLSSQLSDQKDLMKNIFAKVDSLMQTQPAAAFYAMNPAFQISDDGDVKKDSITQLMGNIRDLQKDVKEMKSIEISRRLANDEILIVLAESRQLLEQKILKQNLSQHLEQINNVDTHSTSKNEEKLVKKLPRYISAIQSEQLRVIAPKNDELKVIMKCLQDLQSHQTKYNSGLVAMVADQRKLLKEYQLKLKDLVKENSRRNSITGELSLLERESPGATRFSFDQNPEVLEDLMHNQKQFMRDIKLNWDQTIEFYKTEGLRYRRNARNLEQKVHSLETLESLQASAVQGITDLLTDQKSFIQDFKRSIKSKESQDAKNLKKNSLLNAIIRRDRIARFESEESCRNAAIRLSKKLYSLKVFGRNVEDQDILALHFRIKSIFQEFDDEKKAGLSQSQFSRACRVFDSREWNKSKCNATFESIDEYGVGVISYRQFVESLLGSKGKRMRPERILHSLAVRVDDVMMDLYKHKQQFGRILSSSFGEYYERQPQS